MGFTFTVAYMVMMKRYKDGLVYNAWLHCMVTKFSCMYLNIYTDTS